VYTLFLAPLALGVLCGYATGGRLGNLVRTPIRATWLLLVAASLQFIHFEWAGIRTQAERHLGFSLMIPIFGLVGIWLVINLQNRDAAFQAAILAILLGGLLNAIAIAANGRMPFSESALSAARVSAEQRARGDRSPKHVAADEKTRLLWLGDVIPVAPIEKVVSVGDIVLLLGVATLVTTAMRPPPTRRRGADVRSGRVRVARALDQARPVSDQAAPGGLDAGLKPAPRVQQGDQVGHPPRAPAPPDPIRAG
jgi:hypothetical protein